MFHLSCGASSDCSPTFFLPIPAWNFPSIPVVLHSWAHPQIKAYQAGTPWRVHPSYPCLVFLLQTKEIMNSTFFKSLITTPVDALGSSLAWSSYLCNCFYLPQGNMIYSLWHKSPKKIQFQHPLLWCEKILNQLKKWLVFPSYGRWLHLHWKVRGGGRRKGDVAYSICTCGTQGVSVCFTCLLWNWCCFGGGVWKVTELSPLCLIS